MQQAQLTEKVLLLGVDGMDPRLTKKYLDEGVMPNVKKMVERGAAREDLVLLGAVPTITPPMWTTLATGAYPATHGITDFWGQDPDHLDTIIYNLDSRRCKAEPLWNVTAESGKKTLVFHWPGSAWPPTSQSDNLHVIDGVQPVFVNMGTANVDDDKLVYASNEIDEVAYKPNHAADTGAGCIIKHVDSADDNELFGLTDTLTGGQKLVNIELSIFDGEAGGELGKMDLVNSPLSKAEGWNIDLPENTKEFTILTSGGYTRRMGLLLPNAQGEYMTVAIYKNKKATEPMVVLEPNKLKTTIPDSVQHQDGMVNAYRSACVLELDPAGEKVVLWVGPALREGEDKLFHPSSLYQQIVDHVGQIPAVSINGSTGKNQVFVENFLLESWRVYDQWQADAINHLIKENDYSVVFSHLHNVDCMGHGFWAYADEANAHDGIDTEKYREYIRQVYIDTDDYIGEFMHLLDEGWTIILTSDHGLLVKNEEFPPMGDPFGVNAKIMNEMGYTGLRKDEQGNLTKEIIWEETIAVAARGNHIKLNIKGRDEHGIINPEDQYQVEEKLISDLYNYRDENGKRIISIAMRNKDAALLGLDGDESGDILYWLAEGGNRVHGDSLSTFLGSYDSSVSPIFVAAGNGIKTNFTIDRTIRQVDVTPTMASLLGVRMPNQCEGAPIYPIMEKEVF